MLQLAGERLKEIRPDDKFEAYGKYVAHKLRSLQGKHINNVIFEGELEALTKDFKVTNTQPNRSFENNSYQQFNPQLYRQQPYPPPYISHIPNHQLSLPHIPYPLQHSPHSSNNNVLQLNNTILSNSQTYSQTLNHDIPKVPELPNSQISIPEQANSQQPNTQKPEFQKPNSSQ